ncbi:MAG: intradiol ring-cleavage dioxygenase [Rubrobacteraceae bacterium]
MKRGPQKISAKARNLSRRQMLGLMESTAAAAALAGCAPGQSGSQQTASFTTQAATTGGRTGASAKTTGAATKATPSCVLTPEVTEGPYYLDLLKIRDDITENMKGVPLQLRTTVVNTADDCAPLKHAAVDIWHCNATGDYSGFTGAESASNPGGNAVSQGAPPQGAPPTGLPPDGAGGAQPTDNKTFLRGVQLTDKDGVAEFETIYPGWYQGHALHIHLKMHEGGKTSGKTYEGGHVSHTGQLFFPEDVTERVAAVKPYSSHTIDRVRNSEDNIFQKAGDGSIVKLTGSVKEGFVAEITLGVNPNSTPDPAGVDAGGTPPSLPSTGGQTS